MYELHNAVDTGVLVKVQRLIDQADVNALDAYSQTPLHVASKNGDTKIVQLLLAHKAEINQRDECGNTPLQFAKMFGCEEIIEILKAAGAIDCQF